MDAQNFILPSIFPKWVFSPSKLAFLDKFFLTRKILSGNVSTGQTLAMARQCALCSAGHGATARDKSS